MSAPKPPALPIDLATVSDEALAALAEAAPRELERRKQVQFEALVASMREKAAALGVPLARLMAALGGRGARVQTPNGGKDRRSVVKAKYRDKKTGATWAGRGAPPKWFSDHIAAGGKKEDLLIREPDGDTPKGNA